MNVREYLENYNELGDEIRRLNVELNKMLMYREDTYNTLQAQAINDMPKAQRKHGSDLVSKAVLVIERYSKTIDMLTTQINDLLDEREMFNLFWHECFFKIDAKERLILDLRFIQGKKWREISQVTYYCEDQCRRKAEDAIDRLQLLADSLLD